MSGDALLATWGRPVRYRAVARFGLLWLPAVLVATALAWRFVGLVAAVAVAVAGVALLAFAARRIAARYDRGWLVRRLDARRAELEDSADLLFEAPASPIAELQQQRIATRIAALSPEEIAEPASWRPVALAWIGAALAIAAILLWPARAAAPPPLSPAAEGTTAAPGVPRLTGQRVRIVPPGYTGLPARSSGSLDVRAPAGSRIEWTLAFAPPPDGAALRLLDGQQVTLRRTGDEWIASLRLDRSLLYRVVPAGVPRLPPLHRLEAIADAPPQVRVIEPAQGLVQVRPGQRSWRVVFEASDDYGVASPARMTVTLAQGEGENVTFRERVVTVAGTGDPRKRRFTANLNLAAFGLKPGGDLVAQLTVSDRRSPGPHVTRGPGVILRWPPQKAEQPSGLELMTKRVLPAYFRSQRQIIIDAEALIALRRRLAGDKFVEKSDAIGVDQRLLRLRYGQFLGEEAEGGHKPPPLPVNDADNDPAPAASPTADEHGPGDGHDHVGEAPAAAPTFGQIGDVAAEFGHAHDQAEAATLLDSGTKETLRQALDQMWQSELNLRQGRPEQALPFAYKALAFIKQVQQATRIFLARVGTQLPPVDMTRRMTGKRDGIASRDAELAAVEPADGAPAAAWRALGAGGVADLEALDRWVRANEARLRDPLSLLAAIDGVRADPNCARCRDQLRAQLWTVLSRPPAQVRRRGDGGTAGRRYLQGLR